ncbi:unnamed protein product [Protopolystoma xenopodis]|uniref:Uncharacterized protein n=1 Tax=Protopolystoma xenopodis TaxID=117903 RepID=A0A3S5A2R7_9PLAT|nr:unnamed protein product [Protopolystoma xenopodis]
MSTSDPFCEYTFTQGLSTSKHGLAHVHAQQMTLRMRSRQAHAETPDSGTQELQLNLGPKALPITASVPSVACLSGRTPLLLEVKRGRAKFGFAITPRSILVPYPFPILHSRPRAITTADMFIIHKSCVLLANVPWRHPTCCWPCSPHLFDELYYGATDDAGEMSENVP